MSPQGNPLHRSSKSDSWRVNSLGGGVTTTGPDATTPQLSVKTWGGGAGEAVWEGVGGMVWGGGGGSAAARGGGVPKVGGPERDPLLPHAYLQGGCVSGGLGVRRYVCDKSLGKRERTALEPGKSSECRIFTLQQTTIV